MKHYLHHHHYPSRQLAYRAATKLLQPCLSLASLWMVPQLWFIFFISASTVFARLSSVDHASAFPLGSSGLQLWWWSWHPCAERTQSSAIVSLWWMVSISSCWHVLRGHGWRRFLAKRYVGISWGLPCEMMTAWQGHARSSVSTLIHVEGSTIRSSCRASA